MSIVDDEEEASPVTEDIEWTGFGHDEENEEETSPADPEGTSGDNENNPSDLPQSTGTFIGLRFIPSINSKVYSSYSLCPAAS